MLMPEAAMNKDYLLLRAKHQIGFAWKVFPVQPITEAQGMDKLPDNQLRLHIFGFDRSHVPAALLSCQLIGHLEAGYTITP